MSAFNPYAPPTAPYGAAGNHGGAFAQMLGNDLLVTKDAPLPDVCLKCAAPSVMRRKRQFVFTPPWVIFIMLASLLLGAIIAMIVQKKGTLQLPLCAQCDRNWTSGNIQIALGLLALFAFIALGLVIGIKNDQPAIMVGGMILGIGTITTIGILNRNVRVMSKKVDATTITLTKVHPDACRAIIGALS